MKASEHLFASRILTGVLSMLLIALVVVFYKEYLPDLLVKAEHVLAASMSNMDTVVAAR